MRTHLFLKTLICTLITWVILKSLVQNQNSKRWSCTWNNSSYDIFPKTLNSVLKPMRSTTRNNKHISGLKHGVFLEFWFYSTEVEGARSGATPPLWRLVHFHVNELDQVQYQPLDYMLKDAESGLTPPNKEDYFKAMELDLIHLLVPGWSQSKGTGIKVGPNPSPLTWVSQTWFSTHVNKLDQVQLQLLDFWLWLCPDKATPLR